MKLKVLGSSSEGNCYIFENDAEALILECGVRFDKIKQALKFNLSKVSGCLISHEHKDHCACAEDVLRAGINVFTTAGTYRGMGIDTIHHRTKIITPDTQFTVGSFRIIPFDVKHDAQKPVGFLIDHAETGTILFVTDTYYVEKRFRGLNNILVEANYSQAILDARLASGAAPDFLRNRIFKSHMNLDTCKQLLKANDLTAVNNIVLIHLSDSNSNAAEFKRDITALTGKQVYIAEAGLTIDHFNKQPF